MNQPLILMTIKDRYTTIFECTVTGCKWSRIAALGTQIIAEGEALKHLKTHDESDCK